MSDASNSGGTDLLYGVTRIAEHLDMTVAQVYHLHGRGTIPTFKLGRTVCARRSVLARHFAQQEAAARKAGDAPDAPEPAPPVEQGCGVEVLEGITAIAKRLRIRQSHAQRLHDRRLIPTMARVNRVVATAAALDDYLVMIGGRVDADD